MRHSLLPWRDGIVYEFSQKLTRLKEWAYKKSKTPATRGLQLEKPDTFH
jgi:hypothetical protein